jgi:hypothetical protein
LANCCKKAEDKEAEQPLVRKKTILEEKMDLHESQIEGFFRSNSLVPIRAS